MVVILRGRFNQFRPPYTISALSSEGWGTGSLEGSMDGSGDGMPICAGPHLFNGKDEEDTNGWGSGSSYSRFMVENEYGCGGLGDHY